MPAASTIRPIGDNCTAASCASFEPASAPRFAPSMITTNSRWPLLTLNESAANAHIWETTITP